MLQAGTAVPADEEAAGTGEPGRGSAAAAPGTGDASPGACLGMDSPLVPVQVAGWTTGLAMLGLVCLQYQPLEATPARFEKTLLPVPARIEEQPLPLIFRGIHLPICARICLFGGVMIGSWLASCTDMLMGFYGQHVPMTFVKSPSSQPQVRVLWPVSSAYIMAECPHDFFSFCLMKCRAIASMHHWQRFWPA